MKHRALVFALICAAGTPHAEILHRQTLQSISADGDTFKFRDESSRVLSVALTGLNDTIAIVWPATNGASWDTALLGVSVSSSAEVVAPYVEIESGGTSARQYFRPGDAGPRWLNLSFLRGGLAAGTRVTIRGEGVSVGAGGAPLRLFANGLDLSRSILVLAPHPDDAEIAAFGVYAYRSATIVTITAGNAGPRNYEAEFSDLGELYEFKGRLRVIDSITVPWQGGIPPERTFNMGYFDARLADMHDNRDNVIQEMFGSNTDISAYLRYNIGSLLPKRPRASRWINLVDDIERVLKKVKPVLILSPHPQLDSHRDHQFTTVALAEALTRWRKQVTLLLYTNHADQNRYPYGPAGTIMSLPPPVPQDVLLDRVYSHPVSPDVQRMKLFALESMHDLRLSPSRLYQLAAGDDRAGALANEDPPMAGVSYFRRGPRANELFFVYDRDSLSPMIDAFLAMWRARP